MDVIDYTAARANLAKTMEKVCNDHEPVIITRKRESPVVMLSLEDYQSMERPLICFAPLRMQDICWNPSQNWRQEKERAELIE